MERHSGISGLIWGLVFAALCGVFREICLGQAMRLQPNRKQRKSHAFLANLCVRLPRDAAAPSDASFRASLGGRVLGHGTDIDGVSSIKYRTLSQAIGGGDHTFLRPPPLFDFEEARIEVLPADAGSSLTRLFGQRIMTTCLLLESRRWKGAFPVGLHLPVTSQSWADDKSAPCGKQASEVECVQYEAEYFSFFPGSLQSAWEQRGELRKGPLVVCSMQSSAELRRAELDELGRNLQQRADFVSQLLDIHTQVQALRKNRPWLSEHVFQRTPEDVAAALTQRLLSSWQQSSWPGHTAPAAKAVYSIGSNTAQLQVDHKEAPLFYHGTRTYQPIAMLGIFDLLMLGDSERGNLGWLGAGIYVSTAICDAIMYGGHSWYDQTEGWVADAFVIVSTIPDYKVGDAYDPAKNVTGIWDFKYDRVELGLADKNLGVPMPYKRTLGLRVPPAPSRFIRGECSAEACVPEERSRKRPCKIGAIQEVVAFSPNDVKPQFLVHLKAPLSYWD